MSSSADKQAADILSVELLVDRGGVEHNKVPAPGGWIMFGAVLPFSECDIDATRNPIYDGNIGTVRDP